MRAIAFFFGFIAPAQPYRSLPTGFGVTVFFFLSGYLITSLLRESHARPEPSPSRDFYLRRLLRIFRPAT